MAPLILRVVHALLSNSRPHQEEGAVYHLPMDKDRLKDKLVQRHPKLVYAV